RAAPRTRREVPGISAARRAAVAARLPSAHTVRPPPSPRTYGDPTRSAPSAHATGLALQQDRGERGAEPTVRRPPTPHPSGDPSSSGPRNAPISPRPRRAGLG